MEWEKHIADIKRAIEALEDSGCLAGTCEQVAKVNLTGAVISMETLLKMQEAED